MNHQMESVHMLLMVAMPVLLILVVILLNYQRNLITLKLKFQKLWYDHVAYTREFILASFLKTDNLETTTQRLLQNQRDIGRVFDHYVSYSVYIKAGMHDIATLLTEHILSAAAVVKAMSENAAPESLSSLMNNMYANGVDVGRALNLVLGITSGPSMMKMHLDLTVAEVKSISQQNYPQALRDYEKVVHEAMLMSNGISEALAWKHLATFSLSWQLPCCTKKSLPSPNSL